MGQYHKLINIDKKEYVTGWDIGIFAKHLEQVGYDGSMSDVLYILMIARIEASRLAASKELRILSYGDSWEQSGSFCNLGSAVSCDSSELTRSDKSSKLYMALDSGSQPDTSGTSVSHKSNQPLNLLAFT